MPTVVTHTIGPASKGCDYSDLAAWWYYTARDLTSLDEIEHVVFASEDILNYNQSLYYGYNETTYVTDPAPEHRPWVTATNYLQIEFAEAGFVYPNGDVLANDIVIGSTHYQINVGIDCPNLRILNWKSSKGGSSGPVLSLNRQGNQIINASFDDSTWGAETWDSTYLSVSVGSDTDSDILIKDCSFSVAETNTFDNIAIYLRGNSSYSTVYSPHVTISGCTFTNRWDYAVKAYGNYSSFDASLELKDCHLLGSPYSYKTPFYLRYFSDRDADTPMVSNVTSYGGYFYTSFIYIESNRSIGDSSHTVEGVEIDTLLTGRDYSTAIELKGYYGGDGFVHDTTVRDSKLWNKGAALYLYYITTCLFENNQVDSNYKYGTNFNTGPRPPGVTDGLTIRNNFFNYSYDKYAPYYGFSFGTNNYSPVIYNNVIARAHGIDKAGYFLIMGADQTLKAYNNTFKGWSGAVRYYTTGVANIIASNNAVLNCTYLCTEPVDASSTNNAIGEGTYSNNSGANLVNITANDFIDYVNNDLRITSDSVLRDAGTDILNTELGITTDKVGNPRS